MARKKYNKRDKRKLFNSYMAKVSTPSPKEERGLFAGILRYIKRHPISSMIITVISVLSSVVTIYQFWTSPEEKLRDKIENDVCVIRDTFIPINIKGEYESNQGAVMIKDFQHAVISFVNHWKAVEAIKPLKESRGFEDADAYLRNMYLERERESQINKYRMLYYSLYEVKDKVIAIILYGQKHGIYEYAYSADRWNNISKDFDIIERTVKDTKEQVNNRWKKIESQRGSLDNLPAEELSYTMEPYYKMFDTMETLEIFERFMSFVIDFNAACVNHIEKEMQEIGAPAG
jgi:hypothetical protein